MAEKYIPPKHLLSGFNCPFCEIRAHQTWKFLGVSYDVSQKQFFGFVPDYFVSQCFNCGGLALWVKDELVYPHLSTAPLPSDDMPEDVKQTYSEARMIFNSSPRASAALLRLSVELLMPHLNAQGRDLNDKIGFLVTKGLDIKIQQALDSVRVIGNHAVHPGMIEIDDDNSIALKLFDLLNIIIDSTITKDRRIKELHDIIPEKEKKAIERRDST